MKKNRETLIIDCDGVLYPKEDLQLHEFVDAMKEVAKENNVSEETFERISKETKEKSPGIFNFIHAICDKDEEKHQDFIHKMAEKVDYSRIKRDDNLLNLIKKTQKDYDVVIFTNNTRPHLEKVFEKRFGKTVAETGLECYDISHTKYNDIFHPKQSQLGMKLFSQKIGKNAHECTLVDDTQKI